MACLFITEYEFYEQMRQCEPTAICFIFSIIMLTPFANLIFKFCYTKKNPQ